MTDQRPGPAGGEAARGSAADVLELASGDARVCVAPDGSRVVSIEVGGCELLVQPGEDPLLSGCYPMVPWAGRLGAGRFDHQGERIQLEVDHDPHAIHGLGVGATWTPAGNGFTLDLTGRWPLGGRAETSFALQPTSFTMAVTLTATQRSLPAVLGWHPCFNRRLDEGRSDPVALDFRPAHWWPRSTDGLPTGETEPAPLGPWDDCFGGVTDPPKLRWPDGPSVRLVADTETWVVYDETDHAVCVEPQTAPPNAHNLGLAHTLEPWETVSLELVVEWGEPDVAPPRPHQLSRQ